MFPSFIHNVTIELGIKNATTGLKIFHLKKLIFVCKNREKNETGILKIT